MRDEIKKFNDKGMEIAKPFTFPATGVEVNLKEISDSTEGFLFMENNPKYGPNFMIPAVNVFDPAIKTAYGMGIDGVNEDMITAVANATSGKFASIMTNNVALVANNGLFPFLANFVLEEKAKDLVELYQDYIGSGHLFEDGYMEYLLFREKGGPKIKDGYPIQPNFITPASGDDAVYNTFTSTMSEIVFMASRVYNRIVSEVIGNLIVDFSAIADHAMKADNIDRSDIARSCDQAYASAIIHEVATVDIEKIREIAYYNLVQIYSEYFNLIGFPGYFLDSTKMPN